jgi:maltose alpha-D-glucosyltransferase/alpha-amylase
MDYGQASKPEQSEASWYKDAIIYEVPVRAFYDSDGNGVGDFQGLTEKLDYLQDLGVTALWLLPFYPSPLRDDGYDIADYTDVNPVYGTLRDFKTFLRQAHERGLRVITELVLNHTSDQHRWFQRSRRARPGSSWRDFYVWNDNPARYQDARVIFKDFESSNWSWDPEAHAYFWHRFYSHQPDLNYDNPRVRRAMFQVMDRWLGMGVDGLRLDAVPYLVEREATNCENLAETHALLKELRAHVDGQFAGRMLLAEANQWPEDAIAYFGADDECHTAFHFPLMPRLFMATQMEDRFPIVDIMQQTPPLPAHCQWVLFLRNHDELTLEMVTDEERDYMYRAYARDASARINLGIRRRLAPLLGNNRRKIELMNGLLFSLPGTPVLYYGDEIGMGDNIFLGDRDGVRTPMQWSPDRNAGFSRANPQRIYLPPIVDSEYHYESVNVETQRTNPESLFWWTKRLIALRQRHPIFGWGSLEFLFPENPKVLAFVRADERERILVVANLSRFAQCVELDLSAYEGLVPLELFGRTRFPTIGKQPYLLTFGSYAFYWFLLQPSTVEVSVGATGELPTLSVAGEWTDVLHDRLRPRLATILQSSIRGRRWFGGKARTIQNLQIADAFAFDHLADLPETCLLVLHVEYVAGEPENYLVPLGYLPPPAAAEMQAKFPQAAICRLQLEGEKEPGLLCDAVWHEPFGSSLLEGLLRRRRFKGRVGELSSHPTHALRRILGAAPLPAPTTIRSEQSNSSMIFGDQLIVKLARRVEPGPNSEAEIGAFLTETARFEHVPPLAGTLQYRADGGEPYTVAIAHGFVPNQGTAWQHTLAALSRYFEQVAVEQHSVDSAEADLQGHSLVEMASNTLSPAAEKHLGVFRHSAELLGQRTAELHLALAGDRRSAARQADFEPVAFTSLYQRSLYQSMRKLAVQTFGLLRWRRAELPASAQDLAAKLFARQDDVLRVLHAIVERKLHTLRLRCHGDYHLGQVLYTGNDFVIIDFEGEPARSLTERRLKRSPIQDVASMIRSFHYAAYAACFKELESMALHDGDVHLLRYAARCWHVWAGVTFLQKYLETAREASFLPADRQELATLLDVFLLEKAVYELRYELNTRPDWVEVPMSGIVELLEMMQAEPALAAT